MTLMFILSAAAGYAAPGREKTDVDPNARALIRLAMSAAVLRGVYEMDGLPSQSMVEGMLVMDGQDGFVGDDTAAAWYDGLFSEGSYEKPRASTCPCIVLEDGGMTVDASVLGEMPVFSVLIYGAEGNDFLCDVCYSYNHFDDPGEVPEDELVWLCGARVTLTRDESARFGYTLDGFSRTEGYASGCVGDWQHEINTEYEYDFILPDCFGLAQADYNARIWQTADGTATLSVYVSEGENTPDLEDFAREEMYHSVCMETDGMITRVFSAEGLLWNYTVTLEFPAEKQAEYTLYAELMRNAFRMWGLSDG